MQSVCEQRLYKHVPAVTNMRATIDGWWFRCGPRRGVILKTIKLTSSSPCGGGVEYLHRDHASHRRRRNEKSQLWDSKILSWVPRDSGLRKTALERANSIYKRQTRTLVREGAPQKQDCNCQTVINIGARHQDILTDWLTDWPSVAMWLWLWPVQLCVEGWQLSRALQGRLRRDGAIAEFTVDKSSVAGYSPGSNDMSTGSWRISTVRNRC
jgi:hypothetical protein